MSEKDFLVQESKGSASIQVYDEDDTGRFMGVPHNGKQFTSILISPNNNYVATWSMDDNSVAGWTIEPENGRLQIDKQISFQNKFQDKFKVVGIEAVSDYKHVVIRIVRNDKKDPVNFGNTFFFCLS